MKKYIPELDGLRGIGTVMALMTHFGLTLIDFNWIAIELFFVLSGFLISRILLDEKSKPGTTKEKFKTYWIRRVLRIFPVYYLYLLILGILCFLFSYPSDYPGKIIYLASYTLNFSMIRTSFLHSPTYFLCFHLWSLSAEEQFYLFLPLIIFAFSFKHLKWITVFFILFSPVFRFLYAQLIIHQSGGDNSGVGYPVYWFTCSHLDAFFMGVAVNIFSITKWKHTKVCLFLLFIILLLVGGVNYFFYAGANANMHDYLRNLGYPLAGVRNYQYIWSYSILNIFFCLFITVLAKDSGSLASGFNKFFRLKVLTSIGKVSYGMYVFHWGVILLLGKYVMPKTVAEMHWAEQTLWFIFYVLVLYMIALLSFRFFEMKFHKLKPKYLPGKALSGKK